MKRNQTVIPKMLQNEIKTLLHNGHFGIVRIKNCAREIMFWPGMSSDNENIVRICDVCQQYHKQQWRETFICHEILDIPWIKGSTDLFGIHSKVT